MVSVGQIVVTTIVMLVYSWQLTLRRVRRFLPLAIGGPPLPARLANAYGMVRARVGEMLGASCPRASSAPR